MATRRKVFVGLWERIADNMAEWTEAKGGRPCQGGVVFISAAGDPLRYRGSWDRVPQNGNRCSVQFRCYSIRGQD